LTGAGLFNSLAEAVGLTTHVVETREPQPKTSALYDEYYQIYRATYFSLLPVFEQAAKINS
jgi:pyrroloquinoline quinone (PQQ) biosynthesis protein C